jgi:hypothetical protein
MPIAVLQEWAAGGDNTSNYDAIHEKVTAGAPPDGFLVHTAGATPDGGFRIFEVWESGAQYQRFVEGQLMPILKELGAEGPEPTTTTYELRGFMTR